MMWFSRFGVFEESLAAAAPALRARRVAEDVQHGQHQQIGGQQGAEHPEEQPPVLRFHRDSLSGAQSRTDEPFDTLRAGSCVRPFGAFPDRAEIRPLNDATHVPILPSHRNPITTRRPAKRVLLKDTQASSHSAERGKAFKLSIGMRIRQGNSTL